MVYNPEVVLHLKITDTFTANEVKDYSLYDTASDEVLEIYRIEIVPPIANDGTIQKIKYVTLLINQKPIETLHINSVMLPPDPAKVPGFPKRAVNLGIPVLHAPLTGYRPSALENTTIKVGPNTRLGVRVVAEDAINLPFEIIIYAAYADRDGLARLGPRITVEERALGIAKTVSATPEDFDKLPGGINQERVKIMPFITYARNKNATTPNKPYVFDRDNVAEDFMVMAWNFAQENFIVGIKYLGVIPHANSLKTRIYEHTRKNNPYYLTRPLPEFNYFMPAAFYDHNLNKTLKTAGPAPVLPGEKIRVFNRNAKVEIHHVDNGTSIPANGVEIHLYGVKIEYA